MSEDAHNIISVSFAEAHQAYAGLADLRAAEDAGRIELITAVVVEHGSDGTLRIPNAQSDRANRGRRRGSFVGAVLGSFGGPAGVVVGLAAGVLIGRVWDGHRSDDARGLLTQLAATLPRGTAVLLAEVREPSPDTVDQGMKNLGGTVHRRRTSDVLPELKQAAAAADSARRESRRSSRQKLQRPATRTSWAMMSAYEDGLRRGNSR